MIDCPWCHKQIEEDSSNCKYCGNEVFFLEGYREYEEDNNSDDITEDFFEDENENSVASKIFVTSTDEFKGAEINKYYGIVYGDAVMGANIVRDILASVRDIVGGRSGSYQKLLARARGIALLEMQEMAYSKGANGIVGIRFDIDNMHNMLICNVTGTAVSVTFNNTSDSLEGEG